MNFFVADNDECAIYPVETRCGDISPNDKVSLLKKTLFAVKTCPKFHIDRLMVISDGIICNDFFSHFS